MKYLKPGQTRNVTIHFAKNYASAAQGATIAGDALGTNTNLGNLIDDTEATNNGQTGAPVGGRWVVVKLGTTKPVPIASARRVGAARARQQPLHGAPLVRGVRLHRGQAGEPDVRRLGCSRLDADRQLAGRRVPVGQPASGHARQTLRYFNALGAPPATHVKFVVVANQCTGQPSYAGDQDNDPNNNADCPATMRASEVHATELQVFSSAAHVVDAPRVG